MSLVQRESTEEEEEGRNINCQPKLWRYCLDIVYLT